MFKSFRASRSASHHSSYSVCFLYERSFRPAPSSRRWAATGCHGIRSAQGTAMARHWSVSRRAVDGGDGRRFTAHGLLLRWYWRPS